jgi:Zn-finger nucleic acid-binding protein
MTGDAATLRCPACGAHADSGEQRCRYCKARLATVSCPSCLALMFDSSTFCPSCGARKSRVEYPADARCPSCRGAMAQVTLGETDLLDCETCDGLWIGAAAFERLCSSREAQAAVLHQHVTEPQPMDARVRYRPCIECGAMMNRVNFAKISGTVVDVCKKHGTFLDRGELQAIVSFVHGGGLDRARQRQIEDLKEQHQRLKEQELRRVRSSRFDTPRGSVDVSFGDLFD